MPGTLVGVLFLGVVADGLDLIGLDFNLKAAMQGLILLVELVVAVLVSRLSAEA